ncbi:MAG: hypothetical protein ABWX98_04315 [Lacisediminihabitans sp.]
MEAWSNYAVITGGGAAALVGLLFVAVSIRTDLISQSKALRARVGQILAILVGLLCTSIMVALPNPHPWVLGVELIVAALAIATALILLNRRAKQQGTTDPLERIIDRVNPNVTTAVLIGLSGVGLLFGVVASLYILFVAAIVGFVGCVIGAWLVLIRPVT